MSNQALHKGNFLLLEFNVKAFDGSDDTSSVASPTVVNNPGVLVYEALPGPGGTASRSGKVTVGTGLTVNKPNVQLQLNVVIPGAFGAPNTQFTLTPDKVDVTVPTDNRAITGAWNASGEQPL